MERGKGCNKNIMQQGIISKAAHVFVEWLVWSLIFFGIPIYIGLRETWGCYWLNKDEKQTTAFIIGDSPYGHGGVQYAYSVGLEEFKGIGHLPWDAVKHQRVETEAGKATVFYSASHPWISSLEKEHFPPVGLEWCLIGPFIMSLIWWREALRPEIPQRSSHLQNTIGFLIGGALAAAISGFSFVYVISLMPVPPKHTGYPMILLVMATFFSGGFISKRGLSAKGLSDLMQPLAAVVTSLVFFDLVTTLSFRLSALFIIFQSVGILLSVVTSLSFSRWFFPKRAVR